MRLLGGLVVCVCVCVCVVLRWQVSGYLEARYALQVIELARPIRESAVFRSD